MCTAREGGDVERAIADFTTVIEKPDAAADVQAKARKELDKLTGGS